MNARRSQSFSVDDTLGNLFCTSKLFLTSRLSSENLLFFFSFPIRVRLECVFVGAGASTIKDSSQQPSHDESLHLPKTHLQ